MARPTKTGLEFFSLDCNMSDEVNLIIADHGMCGYGVLISAFQSIYRDKGYYMNWTTREQKLFSRKVGMNEEKVCTIISECIGWGIFNKKMFEEHQILTSKRIQRDYSTATYKRTGVIMNPMYLLIDVSDKKHINNLVSDDGNKPTISVSDDKSTQSRVEYNKINNKDIAIAIWSAYPNKKGKAKAIPRIEKLLKKHTQDELLKAIKRYDDSVKDKQYLMHGSTFFNGGYVDYLDENYTEVKASNEDDRINEILKRKEENEWFNRSY